MGIGPTVASRGSTSVSITKRAGSCATKTPEHSCLAAYPAPIAPASARKEKARITIATVRTPTTNNAALRVCFAAEGAAAIVRSYKSTLQENKSVSSFYVGKEDGSSANGHHLSVDPRHTNMSGHFLHTTTRRLSLSRRPSQIEELVSPQSLVIKLQY